MTLKLVIFDAYGVTLTGGFPDTMKYLAKKYKRDWKELYAILYTKYFNLAAERKITQAEAWKKAVTELKLPVDWKEVREIHYKLMGLNKPVINFATKLKKKTPTLLLSKNTRSQFSDVEKRLKFQRYFTHVINTWELRLPKASKETCQYLFKKFKVQSQEVIYIDDQDSNLAAARELAVHTILYKNFSQFQNEFRRWY